MSKDNEEEIDDFGSDSDQDPSHSNSRTRGPADGKLPGSKGAGIGMGMFEGKSNPFNDMNLGMGAGLGGGLDRFGSGMMGMRLSGHDGHMRHSSDQHFEKNFLQEFEKTGLFGEKKEEKGKEEEKEPEETEEERLARLSKKLDIPEEEQITIVDWAIRGPVEVVRLILEYILIPYKERKYVYKTKDQWFDVDRPRLREKHPEIELPYIEDGPRVVCGTQAIVTYLLHKYSRTELLGNTPAEKVKQATACEIYWDLLEEYYVLCYGEYEEDLNWDRARDKFVNQKFRLALNRMASCLKHRKAEDEVEFYWIDFGIAETISVLNEMDPRFKDQNTYLQNYVSKVFELPQYIVYRRSNRFHERPYNGLGAVYK